MKAQQPWLFSEPLETTVLTLRSILQGQPITFIEHDEEGGWHFFDGRQFFDGSELKLVPLKKVIELDQRITELGDLPIGWRAWRDAADSPWERESVKTKDRTRAKTAALLAKMQRKRIEVPPGTPSIVEMLREDRAR
jgi:hypothetical protein